MNHIEELFQEYYSPGYYKLIDSTHPLSLYIGADDGGHKAIEYRGVFKPSRIRPSNVIGIKQYQKGKEERIVISLLEDSLLSTFSSFCLDLVESTRDIVDSTKGYEMLVNRYFTWKKMFVSNRERLEEKKIMGLIGELLFLQKDMIPTYGKAVAVSSWTGSEKTKKDFSVSDTWFEVKAINSGKDNVTISSFEQLDSNQVGHLIVYKLEKMSPEYNGITLNKLARSIYENLVVDELKDLFFQKLTEAGFAFDSYYEQFVYTITSSDRYLVNNTFPCLRRSPIFAAISQVKYDLLLSKIEPYKE